MTTFRIPGEGYHQLRLAHGYATADRNRLGVQATLGEADGLAVEGRNIAGRLGLFHFQLEQAHLGAQIEQFLAQALDHIAKSAARSRTSTRRLRWIEQRAIFALEGREYRDIDLELPRSPSDESIERMRLERAKLRAENAQLLEALRDMLNLASLLAANCPDRVNGADDPRWAVARAAVAKSTGGAQ